MGRSGGTRAQTPTAGSTTGTPVRNLPDTVKQGARHPGGRQRAPEGSRAQARASRPTTGIPAGKHVHLPEILEDHPERRQGAAGTRTQSRAAEATTGTPVEPEEHTARARTPEATNKPGASAENREDTERSPARNLAADLDRIDTPKPKPRNVLPTRPKTMYLTMPSKETRREDYMDALADRGIVNKDLLSIQRNSDQHVVLTFKDQDKKDDLLDTGVLQVMGQNVLAQDIDNPVSFITVFDAPYEFTDDALRCRLNRYGQVLSIRRGKFLGTEVENGLRHVRMRLDTAIPSYLRLGYLLIGVRYAGQEPTCKRCNQTGHMVRHCTSIACYNCEGRGHVAQHCKEAERCIICKKTSHVADECPYNWNNTPDLYQAGDNAEGWSEDDESDTASVKRKETQMETETIQEQQPADTSVQGKEKEKEKKEKTEQGAIPKVKPILSWAERTKEIQENFPYGLALELPAQKHRGSGRTPTNVTANAPPIRTQTKPAPTGSRPETPHDGTLHTDLLDTAQKNTLDLFPDDNDMETQSTTTSKRDREDSQSSPSDEREEEDDDTLESAPGSPWKPRGHRSRKKKLESWKVPRKN